MNIGKNLLGYVVYYISDMNEFLHYILFTFLKNDIQFSLKISSLSSFTFKDILTLKTDYGAFLLRRVISRAKVMLSPRKNPFMKLPQPRHFFGNSSLTTLLNFLFIIYFIFLW